MLVNFEQEYQVAFRCVRTTLLPRVEVHFLTPRRAIPQRKGLYWIRGLTGFPVARYL